MNYPTEMLHQEPNARQILQKYWLTWQDIRQLEFCGRSKALKIVHALPHSYHEPRWYVQWTIWRTTRPTTRS